MSLPHSPFRNPFYAVLVVVGSVFALTACAYGVMAVQGANMMTRPAAASTGPRQGAELMDLMDEHGLLIMGVEIGVLAVAVIGAITTDDFWHRRAAARRQTPTSSSVITSDAEASVEQGDCKTSPARPAAADPHAP